jgi:hypothetical protein
VLSARTRHPATLERLARAPETATADGIDWLTPIDRARWYFCETLTPLYYTPVYDEIAPEHRRRYNQLTGMLANEVIALLETQFLHAALRAVESGIGQDAELRAAVLRFRDDERRHAEIWRRLNCLSEPEWYSKARFHLVRVPPAAAVLSRVVARHPVAFPVVFWIQLVQEERSVEFSRRCMRMPADRIEPRYAAAYAAHIHDEVRHVQIDRHLIERFYACRSTAVRRATARLFRWIVGSMLLTPVHSSMRVVERLTTEYPDLKPLLPRIRRELYGLAHHDEYHQMMYSRKTTPVTFSLFDRFEEFHQMRRVLRAYRPHPVAWRQP